jgi:hypothetical protein
MRSSITIRVRVAGVVASSSIGVAELSGGWAAVRSPSYRRSGWSGPSIARTKLRCGHCRGRTSARLAEQISSSAFGPRLEAAIVTLTARHRVSRRGISELARDLFGVTLSAGAVDAICQRVQRRWPGRNAIVIHRKLSLGSQSEDGERFAERALPAAATCRLQRRSLFTYLSELLIAHSQGDPFPPPAWGPEDRTLAKTAH